jgi:hypothetical protein
MHRLPVASAAEVGEAGAGDKAASRLAGVIDGREQFPIRDALIDLLVVEDDIGKMVSARAVSFSPLVMAACASTYRE